MGLQRLDRAQRQQRAEPEGEIRRTPDLGAGRIDRKWQPLAAKCLHESITLLAHASANFARQCIDGIKATDRGPATDFGILRFSNMRIALYYLDGDSIRVLPGMERGKNVNPVWAPDGRSLAFLSDRSGIDNVFL